MSLHHVSNFKASPTGSIFDTYEQQGQQNQSPAQV
jgi:hypothetical protein